jgi:ATP-dependent DNA helicase RecQ
MEQLAEVLRRYWGYDGFRPLQAEAMQCVLAGRDSLVVLPTGGGKSLCYQAPALCRDGLAIVVSPLISLMKDQVDTLRSNGIAAAYINSSQAGDERWRVANDVLSGHLKMLYIAPERLIQPRTLDFLAQVPLALIAIDEAHCISEWGHDFRPEYRSLHLLRQRFPAISMHAFTATATPRVREDILRQLQLREPQLLVGSFDRPNLVYRVVRRSGRLEQIRRIIEQHRGESGIVYCNTRRDVETLHVELSNLGFRTAPYHAGLADVQRHRYQEQFVEDQIDTIIATVAFGMGIDKPDVRYVIHAGMPKSLENYQQESGRAGRDGLAAECTLLYSGADVLSWRKRLSGDGFGDQDQMNEPPDPAVLEASLKSIDAMAAYCTGAVCRHRSLVQYFGQELSGESCRACDLCLGDIDLIPDGLIVAQKILSSVVRQQQRFGGEYTALVLKGSHDARVTQNGHDRLSTYGLLKQESLRTIRDWIEQLVGQGHLTKAGEFSVLQVTASGWEVLRGQQTPRLLKPTQDSGADKEERKKRRASVESESWEGVDRGLFQILRSLRSERADELGVPPYIVFGDASLRDMAREKPQTLAEFRRIKGVGEKKLADFGDAFIACIQHYVRSSR